MDAENCIQLREMVEWFHKKKRSVKEMEQSIMTGRREEILALVSELKKIEVNDLAERLSVSKVTIRKDLDALEKRGLLHREHGFAVLNSQDDLNYRLALNYDKKVQIAKLAAKEVANGETIMIESGSSCAILAEIISKTKKDVTIITNSSFIAHYVSNEMNCQIVLIRRKLPAGCAGDGRSACQEEHPEFLRGQSVHRHRRLRPRLRFFQQRHAAFGSRPDDGDGRQTGHRADRFH